MHKNGNIHSYHPTKVHKNNQLFLIIMQTIFTSKNKIKEKLKKKQKKNKRGVH